MSFAIVWNLDLNHHDIPNSLAHQASFHWLFSFRQPPKAFRVLQRCDRMQADGVDLKRWGYYIRKILADFSEKVNSPDLHKGWA